MFSRTSKFMPYAELPICESRKMQLGHQRVLSVGLSHNARWASSVQSILAPLTMHRHKHHSLQCPHGVGLHHYHQHPHGQVQTQAFFFDEAWSPNAAAASVAPQLFAISLFPYLGFLFFLHNSGKTPKLTLFGFYFLLAFVGATIPAGIYAKVHYGTALANVDWLHGSAESLLTITNLLIVLGLRQGIREAEAKNKAQQDQQQQQQVVEETTSQSTAQR